MRDRAACATRGTRSSLAPVSTSMHASPIRARPSPQAAPICCHPPATMSLAVCVDHASRDTRLSTAGVLAMRWCRRRVRVRRWWDGWPRRAMHPTRACVTPGPERRHGSAMPTAHGKLQTPVHASSVCKHHSMACVQLTSCFAVPSSACLAFPCDVNSVNCTSSGLHTSTAADRICGPCRSGFVFVGEVCIDIELRDIALENIGSGNLANFTVLVATAVVQRTQNANGVENILIFAGVAVVQVHSPVCDCVFQSCSGRGCLGIGNISGD